MEEKQSKTNCNIVIIIILMIMVLGLGGYIFYDKVMTKNVTFGSTGTNSTEKDKDEKVEIEINEDDVKAMYNKYMDKKFDTITTIVEGQGFSYDDYFTLYKDTTKSAVLDDYYSYDRKMVKAYLELYKRDKSKISETSNESDAGYYQRTITFSINDVKTVYLDLFGKEKEFISKEFSSYDLGKCKVENDKFVCVQGTGGGEGGPMQILISYNKYEVSNDMVYIYENEVYYDFAEKNYYLNYSGDQIESLNNKDTNILLDSEYSKYFNQYKLGFKQNADGTYYWYNIEKIK